MLHQFISCACVLLIGLRFQFVLNHDKAKYPGNDSNMRSFMVFLSNPFQ